MMNKDNKDEGCIFQCFETYMVMKNIRKMIEDRFRAFRKDNDLKNIDILILYYIYWAEKTESEKYYPVKMADICEKMKFNKGQVSTELDRLVEKDFLTSNDSLKDKRITYYELSEKAKKLTKYMDESVNNLNEYISSKVSEEEIKAFKKVFTCYIEGINSTLN